MNLLDVASTFTIVSHPPKGGRYVVFNPSETKDPSPYDRVQLFSYVDHPPCGFDTDAIFDNPIGSWSLTSAHIIEIFLDHRDNLPIFTIIEKRGKYCRLAQVGGTRQIRDLHNTWFSVEMIKRALSYGTLRLLS